MFQRNPVLQKELVTKLKNPLAFVAQLAFIGVLALAVYQSWPEPSLSRTREQVSQSLFTVFFRTQLILTVLLMPAFAATSFTMEREQSNFDLLRTTPLSTWKLVLGKYATAITYMVILVLCSLPVMVVCFLLGGFSIRELLANYVHLLATVAACGAIGVAVSAYCQRSVAALGVSYLICVGVGVVLEGVRSFYLGEHALLLAAFVFCVFILPICVALLKAAVERLNFPSDSQPKSVEREEKSPEKGLIQLDRSRFPDRFILPPRRTGLLPDGSNPIIDKEFRCEIYGRGTAAVRTIILISIIGAIFFIPTTYYSQGAVPFVYYLITFVMVIAPAFSGPCLTQEKERNTLPLLITTLLTPRQILFGKYWIALRMPLVLVSLLAAPLLISMVFRVALAVSSSSERTSLHLMLFHWPALLLSLLAASLMGLLCSAIFRRTVTAICVSYLLIFLFFLGPMVAPLFLGSHAGRTGMVGLTYLSPFASVAHAAQSSAKQWETMSLANPWCFVPIMGTVCLALFVTASLLFYSSWRRAIGR